MEQEYFKPIKNFETYGISNLGNVKDYRNGKLLNQYPNEKTGGYLQVQIKNPEGAITKNVHRLVGENFLDNFDNFEEIDHIDRNRINNRIDNLRWVSRSDNQKINYKKRFRTDKYSLDDVKKIRDEIFRENNIPIND